jgi:hypothetical protein
MKSANFFFGIAVVVVAGCSSTQLVDTDIPKEWIELSSEDKFTTSGPPELSKKISRDDGSIAFINFNNNTPFHKPGDFMVELYSDSKNCNYLGTSNTKLKKGQNITYAWGKIDAYENLGVGEAADVKQDPICMPDGEEGAAYIFCSQKDNKRVAICISQTKDDPELAEQIFSTFRWIK